MTDVGTTLAQLQKRIDRLERASRLSSASLDDTALEVRDAGGSLRGVFGQQGDGTTAALVVNGPPPPQPSAPIAASVLGGVTASWDGQFTDGAVLPLDWSRTEVHASTTTGFTPDASTLQSTIETAQGATVVIPTDDHVYVRLLARSTSGTPSAPSAETGPYGPAPVVSTDILDGIVTTVKLADDAVTAAKVATGAIGTTEITDSAVTTAKIVAGAVQTAQLDAEAVNASKIAAGAVTTTKLDALAVTSDKIAANAITVGKLDAGSVDATALKADAITGKTITGGVINGAEFHSDNGAGGLVDIANGAVVATADTDWKILIDPGDEVPVIAWFDNNGAEIAAINAIGFSGTAGLHISSGPLIDGDITDWRWVTTMRDSSVGAAGGFWKAARRRDSDPSITKGAQILLNREDAQIGYHDSATGDTTMLHLIHASKFAQFNDARLEVLPPPSSSSALFVGAATGHTGRLIRATVNSVDQFVVTAGGTVAAAADIVATGALSGASASVTGSLSGASLNVTGAAIKSGETWHNPSFAANWASTGTINGSSGYRGMRYRYTAEDEVWVYGAAVASAGAGSTVFTLPAGYRPATGSRAIIPAYFSSGSGTPSTGWAQVTETGAVAVNTGISGWTLATGTQVWLNGKFPLGNIS